MLSDRRRTPTGGEQSSLCSWAPPGGAGEGEGVRGGVV